MKAHWNRVTPAGWALPILLFLLWVLLSGKLDAFHLGTGVLVVVFVVWQKQGLPPLQAPGSPQLRFLRLVPYAGWLFWQMLLSAVQVARVVIHPSRHLDPQLIQFRVQHPSLVAGVILANSITLTPGTLTIELQEDRLVVHALTSRAAGDLLEGDMARRVARLYTDDPLPPLEVISPLKGRAVI
jgi:multicomponent Na+:H+ antiporter subunit E